MSVSLEAAVLTVSDSASKGERPADVGGDTVAAALEGYGFTVVARGTTADDKTDIANQLAAWAQAGIGCIVTTGGTGLSPRDVTPDATLQVMDYEVPGLGEAMRAASLASTPMAMLSRAVAGVRERSLIVNLPGNPKGAQECLAAIAAALPHAIETLQGQAGQHQPPSPGSTAH